MCSANDLRAGVPWGRTVDMIRTWLRQHDAVWQPLVGAPAPRWQQAPKTWTPGPIRPDTTTAVIGEAKTTPTGWCTNTARPYRSPRPARRHGNHGMVCGAAHL